MHRAARILLVDDEVPLHRVLTPLLASRGFVIESATTGAAAIQCFTLHQPDIVVLDLGLPDLSGNDVCRQIRAQSDVPILVLSARSAEGDKITALDQGADDYLTKPFSHEELLARIRVALRRVFPNRPPPGGKLHFADLVIDFERRQVSRGQTEIRLTPKEFELLVHFARHPDQVLTRHNILTAVWGPEAVDHPEHLWVLVGQLRKKLELDPAHPRYFVSEPWVGYRFVTGDDDRPGSHGHDKTLG